MPSFLSEETVNTVQHSKTCHRKNGGSHTTGRGLRTDFLLGGVLLNRTEDLVVLGSFLYGRRRMNRYEHVRLLLCCHPCVASVPWSSKPKTDKSEPSYQPALRNVSRD